MNISPHHQEPTRYPWPGMASRAMMVVGIVLIVLIAPVLIVDPWSSEDTEPGPTATRTITAQAA